MPVFSNVIGTPAQPQFLEVWLRGTALDTEAEGRPSDNVFFFRRTGTNPVTITADAIATQFQAAIAPQLAAALSVEYVAEECTGRYMDDPTLPAGVGLLGTAGSAALPRSPLYVAATVWIKTDGRGRHYRTNKHFSPIAAADWVGDEFTAGMVTRLEALATAIAGQTTLTDADGNTWRMVVLSASLCDFISNPSVFSGAFATGVVCVNHTVTTMRRRRQKKPAYTCVGGS